MRLTSNFAGRTKIDIVSSDEIYIGKAPYGADTSKPVWLICKITSSSDISYASPYFDQIWDDRVSLDY